MDLYKSLSENSRSCLELAARSSIRTIAFPAISAGAYGFPIDRAAGIAVREIGRFLEENDSIEMVVLVCFGEKAYRRYQAALGSALRV